MMRAVLVATLCASALPTLEAQYGQYQGQEPQRVSIHELVTTSALYNERPVIVEGEIHFGDTADMNSNIFELRGKDTLRVVRIGTAAGSMEDLRFLAGQRALITGIFFDLQSVMMPERHPVLRYYPGVLRQDSLGFDKQYFIAVRGVETLTEVESDLGPGDPANTPDIVDPDIDASGLATVDLRALIKDPGPYLGKRIVVLGKFRGSNLYGDLSIRDKRTPRDFVIKVADAAIWVTGRRPRGDGFELNPARRRDTGKWLRVIGQPWEYEETTYLRAEKVEMAEDPDDPDLEPVRIDHTAEKEIGPPPEVIFTLPLAGETIPLDSEFRVQFSKDMNATSFHRNVDLLYADDDGIGNPFPELEVHYDGNGRTLTVKPNKTLEPGKELRLILYDAIEDADGQTLPVEEGASDVERGAAVVLTFRTARG
ncbi:MAG TPA: Ig-like domain-containing protein [Vicinamibacteria bacterium]|nr:Ig-like domain-containing protein [Vicinamibacteria bacterium]